jgi:hypothetical protein
MTKKIAQLERIRYFLQKELFDLVKRIDSRPSLNIEAKFSTFEELQEFVETVRNDPVRKKQKEIILKYFGEGK